MMQPDVHSAKVTNAAVARKMGRSADTVSKYIKKLKRHDNMSIALAGLIRENK